MTVRLVLVVVAMCVACGASRAMPQAPCPSAPSAQTPPYPLTPAASAAPSPPATFDVAAVDDYIARQMPSRGFVGLSVAIVRDGGVVLDKGYGQSQRAPDLAVRPETAFALASISKQFVCAIVLQLAEAKKLSIDDKVATYFPDLTRANDITLYDLMTHVSGYRDNYPLDFVDEEMKQPVTADEVIARYAKRPLDFEPRTRFSYSSTGYKILGRVIEKVTGKALGVVIDERILRPLGMTHSSYMPEETAPGLARGYGAFALGPPEPAKAEGRGWTFGASGIYAPAGDVAKWNVALMSGKVLGPKAYETFSTARRLADGRTTGYGCGIRTLVNRNGDVVLMHSGRDSGFAAFSVMVPRTRSSVIALSNRGDAPPFDLVTEIVALLNKEHRPPPPNIAGPPARDVAMEMLAMLQSGKVDRSHLGDDFNAFLTDAMIAGASNRLEPLGAPTTVEIESTLERGGMEQTSVRFTFATTKLLASMFRSVDGKVQQFLVDKP